MIDLLQHIGVMHPDDESPEAADQVVACCGVTLDPRRRSAFVERCEIPLTRCQYQLLELLIRHPGQAFQRSELIRALGEDTLVLERTIDVHIRSLRKKLGNAAHLIETVRKAGYRFTASEDRPHG
jgi:two-component system phosphate regulon response regulator PhoB